jgi:asparagine synthase (glutamine-hydrolysing)
MSSICGILKSDGAHVDGAEIDAMLRALDHWAADARGTWVGSGIGLGHLLLHTTPQSVREALPFHDEALGIAITGDFRLDNRAALAAHMGIASADLADWPDGRLALRAYSEWGEECPSHLLGDFAFAVWDAKRRQLFCARDPFGVKPFYYHECGGTVAFATEMKGLLALAFVDRWSDETWIGDYLHRLVVDRV